MINSKIVSHVVVNGKRAYQFATYRKPSFIRIERGYKPFVFIYEVLHQQKQGVSWKFINHFSSV